MRQGIGNDRIAGFAELIGGIDCNGFVRSLVLMQGVGRADRAHFVVPGYSIVRLGSALVRWSMKLVDQEGVILAVKNLPGAGSGNDRKPDEHGAV
jgi:hypothetical protein